MQYIIIIVILVAVLALLAIIASFNFKKIKELGHDKVLDELVRRFPSNIQICQYILNKLGNKHTKIKEAKDSQTSLYLVANDTISIANINDTYTRVQTIAHECLHSMQSKKMLWFNFVYSNIFIIAYLAIIVLTISKVITNGMLFVSILLIMTIIYFFIRSILEIDAMLNAKYLAKEYIVENKLTSKGNLEIIMKKYTEINDLGVKATCFSLLLTQTIKIIIYCAICAIFIA